MKIENDMGNIEKIKEQYDSTKVYLTKETMKNVKKWIVEELDCKKEIIKNIEPKN